MKNLYENAKYFKNLDHITCSANFSFTNFFAWIHFMKIHATIEKEKKDSNISLLTWHWMSNKTFGLPRRWYGCSYDESCVRFMHGISSTINLLAISPWQHYFIELSFQFIDVLLYFLTLLLGKIIFWCTVILKHSCFALFNFSFARSRVNASE